MKETNLLDDYMVEGRLLLELGEIKKIGLADSKIVVTELTKK